MATRLVRIALPVALILAGCSHPLKIDLSNNSGIELRFHTRDRAGGQSTREVVTIAPGTTRTFESAEVLLPGLQIRMEAAGCEVAYQITDAQWRRYPHFNHLRLQVQQDLSIRHLGSAPGQEADDPLTPVSRVCP